MTKLKMCCLLFALPMLSACASPVYKIAPIDAVVIDGQTGVPIEGAIVVANWQLVRGGLDGPHNAGQLEVREAVTDKHGRFHIDGFVRANPLLKELRNSDPRLLFFKPGYEIQRFTNTYGDAGTDMPGPLRRSQLDGGTIRMVRTKDVQPGERRRTFYSGFNVDLEAIVRSDCDWKKIPRTLLAGDAEKRRLKSLYPDAWVDLLKVEVIGTMNNPGCGAASEFFKNWQQ